MTKPKPWTSKDGVWTNAKPELDESYFKAFWVGAPHNRWSVSRAMRVPTSSADVALWNQPNCIPEIRTVQPVPAPTPPPLPEDLPWNRSVKP